MSLLIRNCIFFLCLPLLTLISCNDDDDITPSVLVPDTSDASLELLESISPVITTAVFQVINGQVDNSVNFINDEIANGTVSSAQYRDGKFIFVPVDPETGDFPMPIGLDESTSNFGKFGITESGGVQIRTLFDTNFGFTNEREIIELTSTKFTYSFSPQNSSDVFYVEHEPYNVRFPNAVFPEALTNVINERFRNIDATDLLEESTPLITTAVFQVINGQVDNSVNFINDEIANGTVSSAQYRDGKFIFVPVDPETGDFPMPISLDESTSNFGKFSVTEIEGVQIRTLFDTNFGFTNEREIIELTSTKFTYSFSPQNSSDVFHVEHEPYNVRFPNAVFPEALTNVINERFELID